MKEKANVYRDPWGATRVDLTITAEGHTVTGSARHFGNDFERNTKMATDDARVQAHKMLRGLGVDVP